MSERIVEVTGALARDTALREAAISLQLETGNTELLEKMLPLPLNEILEMSDMEIEELGLGSFLKNVVKNLFKGKGSGKADPSPGNTDAATAPAADAASPAEGGGTGGVTWIADQHPRDATGRFSEKSNQEVPAWPINIPDIPGVGRKGEDPFVTDYNGKKVLIESTDGNDLVVSYTDLSKLDSKQATKISLVNGEKNIWAPELHKINGDWKVFYSSTGQSDNNEDHRMYVLGGSKTPFGPFTTKTELGPPGIWGIDMTPFKVGSKNYVSWSGWDDPHSGFPQNLYIAELKTGKNGALSTGPRVKIASPSGWEGQIMEGPQVIKDPKGNTLLTYSGNKSWTTDYSLGAIKLKGDPLKASSWKKNPVPLASNVGHGSFVDGKLVFHTKTTTQPGWDDRELRVTSYKWVNGFPVLAIPKPKVLM